MASALHSASFSHAMPDEIRYVRKIPRPFIALVSFLVAIVVIVVVIVLGMRAEVQIPKDHYGVLVRMGEAVDAASGPTQINRTKVVESVVIFPKEQELVFTAANGTRFVMILEVVDPRKFYIETGGHGETLISYFRNRLNRFSPDQGAAFLMAELNKPETGLHLRLAN